MAAAAVQLEARVRSASGAHLELEAQGWPGHAPGQFAMLRLEGGPGHSDPLLPRPMAVFRGDASALEFRFKVVGRGTARLAELRPGARVGLLGPLGRGFPLGGGPALLVGGGTGIASLYELAQHFGSSARVVLGARSAAEVLALGDFEALPVQLTVTTEDGSRGVRGRVTDALDELKPGLTVFACGPDAMMRAVAQRALSAGAACFVSLESPMACGFRICLGCAVRAADGIRYVCSDGPVFAAAELGWGVGQ
jgi:dihydroorotate dehydrogenase electron transfer subunit